MIKDKTPPIQYQKGYVEFYKLKFKVTPDVLIPRPETELLVDYVVDFVNSFTSKPENKKTSIRIIDLGTGAGNIAISLAFNLRRGLITQGGYNVNIIATDVSMKALKIARQNAKLHGVEKQITFVESNLLSAFCHPKRSEGSNLSSSDSSLITQNDIDPDVIVTNLPYIPSYRIPYLDSSVKDFEPLVALDGGKDGFDLYRRLLSQIREKDWKPKLIVGEIDYTQADIAIIEAQKFLPDCEVEVKLDLAHKQRILIIKNH